MGAGDESRGQKEKMRGGETRAEGHLQLRLEIFGFRAGLPARGGLSIFRSERAVAGSEGCGFDSRWVGALGSPAPSTSELGSQLLRQWGLPTLLADIAGVHHNDSQDPLAAACQFAEHLSDAETNLEPSKLMEHPLVATLDLRQSQMEIIVDVYREELTRLQDLV